MRKLALLLVVALLYLPACGGGAVEVPEREAVDAAIHAYVRERSMDIAVDSYESFTTEGATATAVVRMKYAGEGYGGPTQAFGFDLERRGDGGWRVAGHEKP